MRSLSYMVNYNINKAGTFGLGSRTSSRKSNNRVYSPHGYGNKTRETNISDLKQYFESSPKSFNPGQTKSSYKDPWSPESTIFNKTGKMFTKGDQLAYPIYKRTIKNGSDRGNATDIMIKNTPFESDSNLEHDDSSAKLSDASIPKPVVREHPYFNRRKKRQFSK